MAIMGMRGLLCMTILVLWTSNVVAPIPGLSSLPSLSDIFSAGVDEPTTVDPSLSETGSAGAGAAGSFALDKGIHLGNPKLGTLDANLDLAASGSKSIGITKGVTADPRVIIFDIPSSTYAPPHYAPVQYAPPPHYAPAPSYQQPPPHYQQPPQRYNGPPQAPGPYQAPPQHYNVHSGNRPQY